MNSMPLQVLTSNVIAVDDSTPADSGKSVTGHGEVPVSVVVPSTASETGASLGQETDSTDGHSSRASRKEDRRARRDRKLAKKLQREEILAAKEKRKAATKASLRDHVREKAHAKSGSVKPAEKPAKSSEKPVKTSERPDKTSKMPSKPAEKPKAPAPAKKDPRKRDQTYERAVNRLRSWSDALLTGDGPLARTPGEIIPPTAPLPAGSKDALVPCTDRDTVLKNVSHLLQSLLYASPVVVPKPATVVTPPEPQEVPCSGPEPALAIAEFTIPKRQQHDALPERASLLSPRPIHRDQEQLLPLSPGLNMEEAPPPYTEYSFARPISPPAAFRSPFSRPPAGFELPESIATLTSSVHPY
jgi:hypothetical protein